MGKFRNEESLGKRLLEIKEQLETKKEERQELQGELKSLMKQLKELGIDDVAQAEKEIKTNEVLLNEMEDTINNDIEELEELINDDD